MTRARDLVVASASIGRRSAGWYNELQPLIGKDVPSIPYADLRRAAETSERETVRRPAASGLAAALETLSPPPEKPKLRRLPATRLARESDRMEPDPGHGPVGASEKAAALGSLGHAVLEQLALSGWDGSVDDWLARLRDEFNIGMREAAALTPRIDAARQMMRDLTAGQEEMRPELPFVLHDADRLIDGTIDLLCRTGDKVSLFDYKFTEADTDTVLDTYRRQMEIYCRAARKAFPESRDPTASLVVVGPDDVRVVPIQGS
jgi:ATP-dependent exoDNAse (exonuclease V) beta subunit